MPTRLVIILGLCWFLLPVTLQAQAPQEMLGPDIQGDIPWITPRPSIGRNTRDTIQISPSRAFVDDFSRGNIPDSGFWYLGGGRYPLIRRQAASLPPSFGTASFDGISPFQEVYATILGRGPADRLETHYIDLSNQDPDNEIYLSFDLQVQGYGHAPNSRDSFKVYFNAGGIDPEEEIKVFALSGEELAPGFHTFFIPVQETRYFHPRFYIAFENEGLLNGMLSNWHLDYVSLGISRTLADTAFNDKALVGLERPLFDPYSAIPFMQYRPNTYTRDTRLQSRVLANQNGSLFVREEVSDPVGGNILPPYSRGLTAAFSGVGTYRLSAPPLPDNQTLNSPYASTFEQKLYFVSRSIGNVLDSLGSNDTLIYRYRVDSLFACDDGEADVGYGINRSRGFAQQYVLREPDSLMAVWIHFVPQINYVFGGSLEDKIFSLAIWTSPDRDSIIYEEGFPIRYGNTPDHFERYELQQPISVSGDIWVGIIQNDNVPVGVGMDRSWENDSLVAWDSSGVWVNSRLGGTLMIRPELRNIRYNPLPPPASIASAARPGKLSLVPRTDGQTAWRWDGPPLERISLHLTDLQGRQVWQSGERQEAAGTIPAVAAGTYFLQALYRHRGTWFRENKTIQILPR